MIDKAAVSAVAILVSAGWAVPTHAQDAAAVQQELAAMRAQMEQMAHRIDTLESQLATAQAKADTAETKADTAQARAEAATTAVAALPAPSVTAKPPANIAWDGAPRLSTKSGWSFKPRGRMELDAGSLALPSSVNTKEGGFATEFRRAYIGVEGTMPGGFGYRAEVDVASSSVQITDFFLTYKPKPELTLTLGQQKPPFGLEEMTGDTFTSFQERASYTQAFGFERRLGFEGAYVGKAVVVQAGVFSDDLASLNSDTDNSYSINCRVVFMPRIGSGQLHIGGSAYYREFNDLGSTTRYSVRPFIHTTDLRLVDTKAFSATGERGIGAELAYINGRFHATGEGHWLTAVRPGLPDPTFNGGYAEVGYLLTDDVTAYKAGAYDRIHPKHPLGSGGFGALQINARYDWLDLNSAGIVGGRQKIAGASLLWIPTDYVRFILDYGHIRVNDAAVLAGADRDYSADAFGMRAQFDF